MIAILCAVKVLRQNHNKRMVLRRPDFPMKLGREVSKNTVRVCVMPANRSIGRRELIVKKWYSRSCNSVSWGLADCSSSTK